ncbi:hypothetical protein B0H34DRAFT_726820 [Crassisporium funariophilum]|nr:hypothetical protein B0H34DRAFT_726820 [Crassisporium funariophilum]
MVARSLLLRHLRAHSYAPTLHHCAARRLATQPARPTPVNQKNHDDPPRSWLTRKVESSPAVRGVFLHITNMLGYGSPKQLAGRRALVLYENVCAVKPDDDSAFWQDACYLPPTFQSWFTITNLHIWMLTVRLRALPAEHGKYYQQALIDHFFIDIEDRIRTVLQPPPEPTKPYTFTTPFYVNPNAPPIDKAAPDGKKKPRGRAPDRIVTRQMKIFKEQWAGMGLSFDLGLVKGDMELAGAVWRNLLGARGAQGITYPDAASTGGSGSAALYRRSVNLVGGEVVNVAKIDVEKEEGQDDGSGVFDFPPPEVDKYLTYPTVMLDVVRYVRREVDRLDKISDEEIMSGDWKKLTFGRVR